MVKVLVVDDFGRWCRQICSMLQKLAELQVVGEASDGLEAVQRARDLQPDLILLDVGLPGINGIEAARRIRESSPTTKILFVSEGCSPDVAEAALGTGARGYVIKSDAGTELLPAVEGVLRGERFISARLALILNERAEDGIEKN
jgi:DNA-binding NarL/FixJ family response regulator